MPPKTYLGLIAILACALLLAACSANSSPPSIEVTLSDYQFSPNEWRVPAGKEVSLKLNNTGSVEHEWVIMKVPVVVPFGDKDEPNVFWEHEVEANGTQSLTFTAPTEPGEYEIVCGIAGHIEHGMRGKLVVFNQ